MIVLGYTLEQTELLLYSLDLGIFTAIESDSALFFYQTLCINSGQLLDTFLVSLLEKKGFPSTLTFGQLESRARLFFRCYATRIQDSTIQEFSLEKTPNHSILFAVRASMCLPIIFAPLKDPFTETLYYDAALIHNMPFVFLTEEEKRQSLSVYFDIFKPTFDDADITNVFQYAFKSFYNLRNVYYLKQYSDATVVVKGMHLNFLDCNLKETKDLLVERGYSACIHHLDRRSSRRPVRRYSVA
jgi:NTE family protein